MSMLSRRQFLHLSGITMAAGGLVYARDWIQTLDLPPQTHGRALTTASVHDHPGGRVVTRVLPDSVVAIESVLGRWFLTPKGFIAQHQLQPMHAAATPTSPTTFPALVEVCAPSAIVYEAASAQVTPNCRIGHGGVVTAIDFLPDTGADAGWYALQTSSGSFLGWSPAARWSAAPLVTLSPAADRLALDAAAGIMTVYSGSTALGSFATAVGENVAHGTYHIGERSFSSRIGEHEAAPWLLQTVEGLRLYGVYWHHRFNAVSPGADIELPPLAAHWVYNHLGPDAAVIVA